jgi:glycine cleavage system H protein
MSSIPAELRYTKDHEWIKLEDEFTGLCGITDYAQEMLTDIVFVELPEKGDEVKQGQQIAVVESVKAVSDVYSPVSGKITEVNLKLEDAPELLNTDPYGEGWIFKIDVSKKSDIDDLMDSKAYTEHVESGGK